MKLFLSIFVFLLGINLYGNDFSDISVDALEKAIQAKKVSIIDVNGPKSFKNGRIPGAIDFSKSQKNLKELLPEDKTTMVVAYCGGPACRAYLRGAKAAADLGYTNVRHLSAGISGWKKAGKKIEKN